MYDLLLIGYAHVSVCLAYFTILSRIGNSVFINCPVSCVHVKIPTELSIAAMCPLILKQSLFLSKFVMRANDFLRANKHSIAHQFTKCNVAISTHLQLALQQVEAMFTASP